MNLVDLDDKRNNSNPNPALPACALCLLRKSFGERSETECKYKKWVTLQIFVKSLFEKSFVSIYKALQITFPKTRKVNEFYKTWALISHGNCMTLPSRSETHCRQIHILSKMCLQWIEPITTSLALSRFSLWSGFSFCNRNCQVGECNRNCILLHSIQCLHTEKALKPCLRSPLM